MLEEILEALQQDLVVAMGGFTNEEVTKALLEANDQIEMLYEELDNQGEHMLELADYNTELVQQNEQLAMENERLLAAIGEMSDISPKEES